MITMIAEEFRRWLLELAVLYIAIVAAGATLIAVAGWFGRSYWKFHEPKTVICPETGCAATVEVDALHAAVGALLGEPKIRLVNCSRWNGQAACEQPCVTQLVAKA